MYSHLNSNGWRRDRRVGRLWEEDDKSCNVKGRWEKKISGGSESKHKKKED